MFVSSLGSGGRARVLGKELLMDIDMPEMVHDFLTLGAGALDPDTGINMDTLRAIGGSADNIPAFLCTVILLLLGFKE